MKGGDVVEQWKDIPGYEGIYEASDMGRIRTCEGKVTRSARFEHRVWKQRVLKQKYAWRKGKKNKDARVSLWRDGCERTWLVSRLIALAWCSGYYDGATVNHIDCNPLNNNAYNLEWVSREENIRKAHEDGLFHCEIAVELIGPDGNREQFRSMASASRFLGKSSGYISDMLAKGKTHVACGYSVVITE
jgi:hypothetical protein